MSEQPPPEDPFRAFTTAGRLLVIATLILVGGGFFWNVLFVSDNFKAGSYPVAFLLIPVLIVAAVFFIVVALILRLFGIDVFRDPDDRGKDG